MEDKYIDLLLLKMALTRTRTEFLGELAKAISEYNSGRPTYEEQQTLTDSSDAQILDNIGAEIKGRRLFVIM